MIPTHPNCHARADLYSHPRFRPALFQGQRLMPSIPDLPWDTFSVAFRIPRQTERGVMYGDGKSATPLTKRETGSEPESQRGQSGRADGANKQRTLTLTPGFVNYPDSSPSLTFRLWIVPVCSSPRSNRWGVRKQPALAKTLCGGWRRSCSRVSFRKTKFF